MKMLYVGWADLDSNGHMKNTAYLDKAVACSVDALLLRVHHQCTTGGEHLELSSGYRRLRDGFAVVARRVALGELDAAFRPTNLS